MSNPNIEYETEKIARRLSKELQDTEALWQMYLHDAYEEYFRLKKGRTP